VLVAEALLVATGQECGPRGAANGSHDVSGGKYDAAARERVDVWGADVLGYSLATKVSVTQVVQQYQNDVGLSLSGGDIGAGSAQERATRGSGASQGEQEVPPADARSRGVR